MPCRSATTLATAFAAKLSATIRAFSSADHRRRRSGPLNTELRALLCSIICKLLGKRSKASLPKEAIQPQAAAPNKVGKNPRLR